MKSRHTKAAMLITAALAIGAAASPTMAKTYTFTFTTQEGGHFCDGLTISDGDGGAIWTGNHIGCTDNDPAGGFTVAIKSVGKYIDINTTDNKNVPGVYATFLLDIKNKQWFLYNNELGNFQLFESGSLLKGMPDVVRGGHSTTSTLKDPRVVDRPSF